MKKLNHNKNVALIGLIALLLLTYFRENFLLGINARLILAEFDRSYFYWSSDFFKDMPKELLIKWKWGLTIFFSVLMPVVTSFSIYCWFQSIYGLKTMVYLYLITLIIVCLFALVGFLTNSFNDIYFILRKILGVLQSPLPFFLFFTLFYWDANKK